MFIVLIRITKKVLFSGWRCSQTQIDQAVVAKTYIKWIKIITSMMNINSLAPKKLAYRYCGGSND